MLLIAYFRTVHLLLMEIRILKGHFILVIGVKDYVWVTVESHLVRNPKDFDTSYPKVNAEIVIFQFPQSIVIHKYDTIAMFRYNFRKDSQKWNISYILGWY